jgi:hypothetical protein
MNSKTIIGAVVGAIILFLWQFLSWAVINIHSVNQKYSAKQAEILDYLKTNIGEDGTYFMPNVPPNASSEDQEKIRMDAIGKPWAEISYHSAFDMSMPMNMGRGVAVNFITLLLLMWLLAKNMNSNFTATILSCLAVGLIAYLSKSYTNSIWFKGNTLPDLVDAIVGWGVVGAWLGYWMNRK